MVLDNENVLKSKYVNLFNRETGERSIATDYFLPVKNLEYEEIEIENYFIGASNTSQTTYIRLTFMLEESKLILDHSFKSSGSFAASFFGMIDGRDSIADIVDEVASKELPLEECGITYGQEGDYRIVVAMPEGNPIDIEVEKDELMNSLVGIEVYKFEQEIDRT